MAASISLGLQAGCGAQLSLPIREAGTWCRWAEEAVMRPWEHSSRCQGTEMVEQTAAAIKTHPALTSITLQVSRVANGSYYSVFPHAHIFSTCFSLGLDLLALADCSQCEEGLLLREVRIVFQGAGPASTFVVALVKRPVYHLLVNVSGEFTQCEVLRAPSIPSLHKSLLQQWEEHLPFVSETSEVLGLAAGCV